MKNSFFQQGSSLLQVTVIGAVLAGLGVYLMQTTQQQNKIARTAEAKGAYAVFKKEISEALASSETCQMTLSQYFTSPIETDMKRLDIPGMKTMLNSVPADMYMPGQSMFKLKISKMQLVMPDDYVADDAMRMQNADFAVFLSPERETSSANSAYGAREVAVRIPLFLFMLNKRIMMCLSVDAQTVIDALHESCLRLGGSFNAVSGICENLHGTSGLVIREVRDHLCSTGVSNCASHPYAGLDCRNHKNPPPVVSGKNNWVLRGLRADGTPDCACVPVKACENPANHCKGIDLGTDWCFNDCGEGTKEDGICAACNRTDWAPDPATRCSGQVFTQTNGCGETQQSTGTMTDNWTPAASTVCAGDTFTQYSSCGAAPRYNVAGTKDCSCPPIARPNTWSETIAGKTYDCVEAGGAGSTRLKHKETLTINTATDADNQGSKTFECKDGALTETANCSSLPKTLSCKLYYQYRSSRKTSSTVAQPNWAIVTHSQEKNCDDAGEYCGIRVGISCTGDDQVKVTYQYKEFNRETPPMDTGWSNKDGTTKWGGWSQMNVPGHHREECNDSGRKCGVKMAAETKEKIGSCTIRYQHRWRKDSSPIGANGAWGEENSPNSEDDGCKSPGCGIWGEIQCKVDK